MPNVLEFEYGTGVPIVQFIGGPWSLLFDGWTPGSAQLAGAYDDDRGLTYRNENRVPGVSQFNLVFNAANAQGQDIEHWLGTLDFALQEVDNWINDRDINLNQAVFLRAGNDSETRKRTLVQSVSYRMIPVGLTGWGRDVSFLRMTVRHSPGWEE